MEHLEDVEAGTERAKEVIESNAGVTMDAENEQNNADCEEEVCQEHPDFVAKNPDNLENQNVTASHYKRIELYSDEQIRTMTTKLDKEQRIVLDIAVDYAKNICKAKNGRLPLPKAPLVIVQGGAGTGKSTVIDAMSQHIEKVLRKEGDDPNNPYLIKAAFTGTAAANIKGQTMHNAFSFNFGNEFLSLGDKARDEKRKLLENLQVVIIDEYSMIKADMLYQLDLRLKEIKQRPDTPFGGVSVFLFGDILQLRPVQAKYIFEEPTSESFYLNYLIDPLWKKFDVIMLITNHRQGEDKVYADILNRMRVGDIQEDDIKMLQQRVRQTNHPDIPNEALVVSCKNVGVNKINENKLALIVGKEYSVQAITKTATKKAIKARTDASGAIRNTPLQHTLNLKTGARVMLTFNIDTCDCLTNGTFGEVIGFESDSMNNLSRVIIEFDSEISGKERRKKYTDLQRNYHPRLATPVDKIEFNYSLSKKPTSASSNAIALQFPLKLAFAATAHKVQGSTIKKPAMLVIDLRTVREAAQAYVMLSRVQALSQLVILEDVCPKKIYASEIALQELDRMKSLSMNNQLTRTKLVSCNIRSISKNFDSLMSSAAIKHTEVICLQETWLHVDMTENFQVDGFSSNFNSIGRGKGIATFYRPCYTHIIDICCENYQITKISSDSNDIINIYRSEGAQSVDFMKDLTNLLDLNKATYLVGDFNLCYKSEKNHPILKQLRFLGFEQMVKLSTHIAGRMIDHVHFYSSSVKSPMIKVQQQSPYFSDHDLLLVSEVGKI